VADRGEMQHLWDVEGNKYLDFLRRHPDRLRGSLQPEDHQQSERAGPTGCSTLRRSIPTNTSWRWRRRSRKSRPGNLQQSFFTNSGNRKPTKPPFCSRACPPAATTWWHCAMLISGGSSLAKAVHPRTRRTARVGSSAWGISHAVNPYCYRCPAALEVSRLRSGLRRGTWRILFRPEPAATSPRLWPNQFKALGDSSLRRRSTSRLFSRS